MKQNGIGIRLVQRKFAQGVPLPASHIAQVPPERRVEPAKERTVYHTRMSARNLLDIVALQNVHGHKQPMVLVERLRVDDIPTTSTPTAVVKKRPTPKAKKNKMCLRPREKTEKIPKKRKSNKPIGVPVKKRARVGADMSPTNDDDTPLLYLRKNPVRPAEPDKEGDKGFTFKRPTETSIIKYRQFQRRRSVTPSPLTVGRSFPVARVTGPARRSGRRPPAPAPHPATPAPAARPVRHAARPRLLSVKPKTVIRKPIKRHCPVVQTLPKAPIPTEETNGSKSLGTTQDVCVRIPTPPMFTIASVKSEAQIDSDKPRAPTAAPQPATPQPAQKPCPSTAYNSVQEVVVAATAQCPLLAARCRACHSCAIVAKILHLTDLVRSDCANPGAVYDFNTELDEAMCPSLSCHRVSRRLARAAGETAAHLYLDLFPPDIPQIIQILCKQTVDKQLVSSVSVVARDVAANADHPTLFEHENLLDQLLECMGRRALDQIVTIPDEEDDIKIEETPLEPQPSTSSEPQKAEAEAELQSNGVHDDEDIEPDDEGPTMGTVVDAPVFRPTSAEFTDPIAYYTKIQPEASKYGLCKIVPPPGFNQPCNINDNIRFAVIYQYISKLYNRWGPVTRELAAIKAHLRTQSVVFARAPLLDGREVNLPKLYHSVERHGGPTKVIQKKRWGRVAEEMKLTKLQNPERKLDQIYMRYLLPYATLSNQERQDKMTDVEKYWATKYQKMLARARNPLHRQKRLLGESESSSDSGDDGDTADALLEAEDCIVQGRAMNLATFKKTASSLMEAQFPGGRPDAATVERAYWSAVLLGSEHVVANTASLDTGEEGYGFPKDGRHPWNLKMLASNQANVLRLLGPVLGVTVPTLHLSMLFSTSCWHRDPHGLPWVEFMHSGPEKIWYGIPSSQSGNFRRAVETLCPAYCQNKPIWLASDIAMIPPEVLSGRGVGLARLEQRPGEFVMVFPEAHTCSITTGYSVSESVYFAPSSWLDIVYKLFQELRNSCEPTMFSLEQLLMNGAQRAGAAGAPEPSAAVLATLLRNELRHRAALEGRRVKVIICDTPLTQSRGWHASALAECEYCRASLYLSKVVGLTARRTPLCPQHARRLLEASKYKNVDATSLELHSSYSTAALEALLKRLQH